MAKKRTQLPALTTLESIKEALDVRLGRRGDKLDTAVTFRDLEESGAFRTKMGGGGLSLLPFDPPPGENEVDLETWVPSAPSGFKASAMFGGIFLEWDWPPNFGAIGFTEVYRATSNDATKRQLLTVGDMLTYVDLIDGHDETEYFYWVRFRSLGDKVGPFAGPVSAVSIPSVKDVMDAVVADIEATDAYKDITADIVPFDEQFGEQIARIEDRMTAVKDRVAERVEAIKSRASAIRDNLRIQLASRVLDAGTITDELIDTYMNMSGVNTQTAYELARIASVSSGISQAGLTKIERLEVDEGSALYTRFTEVEGRVGNAEGSITNIVNLDIAEDSVLYTRFDTVEGRVGNAEGSINDIVNLDIAEDSVLYTRFNAVEGRVGNAEGSINDIVNLDIAEDSVLYTRFNAVEGKVGDVEGSINDIVNLDIAEDSVLYTRFHAVEGKVGDVEGSIKKIEDLTLDESSALYTKLDSASVTAGEASSSADSILTLGAGINGSAFAKFVDAMAIENGSGGYASFEETKSLAEDLSGQYSIKLDNNGHVAGFGLYNTTGEGSSFAVRADKFFIVNSKGQGGSTTPFTVTNGNVYLRKAFIEKAFVDDLTADILVASNAQIGEASIDWAKISDVEIVSTDIKNGAITNAKIGNVIQSDNFSSGSAGWRIQKDGNAEFNSADFRGTINFADLRVSGQLPSESVPVYSLPPSVSGTGTHTVVNETRTFYASADTGSVSFSGTFKLDLELKGTISLSVSGGHDGSGDQVSYSAMTSYTAELELYDGSTWHSVQRISGDGPSVGGTVWVVPKQTRTIGVDKTNEYHLNFNAGVLVGKKTGNFTAGARVKITVARSGSVAHSVTPTLKNMDLWHGFIVLRRF